MMLKRLICFFTVTALIFSLVSCRSDVADPSTDLPPEDNSVTEYGDSITLLCCYADSFNPYTATSEINRNLSRLIFDPLVKLDNNYEPIYCLAQDITHEQNVYTVTLKNAYFTDGTQVCADDVVYSYNLARASSTIYASQLYEVTSATAAGGTTVVFRLTRQDPYFERLLDFPILKSGSDKRTNVDDVVLPPIGSGRFYPSEDGQKLLRYDNYFGKKSSIAEINLVNSPDAQSVAHYVEVGATDFYYTDIADGNIVRTDGKRTEINLNHIVYIGINHSYDMLGEKNMRYALATAIDRAEICKTAYYNNATPAAGFFPPYFKDTVSVQTLQKNSDLQITVENLEKIGYNKLDDGGKRLNSSGKPLTFSLLVNSENRSRVLAARLISEQLAQVGITINVVERTAEQYMAALTSGNFQLYLGEVRLLGNMDISGLVLPGTGAAYGVIDSEVIEESPLTPDVAGQNGQQAVGTQKTAVIRNPIGEMINAFYSSNATAADLAGVAITQMPVIPVCFRNGLLFSDNSVSVESGEIAASRSDIFLSAQDWICIKNKK